jgi:hypothetical protein
MAGKGLIWEKVLPPDQMKKATKAEAAAMKMTIHQELPEQVTTVLKKENLKIKLDKAVLTGLRDQRVGTLNKDGCISAPSGPGC